MGTQFASRLTARDAERVLAGIRAAWRVVPEARRRGRPRAAETLSAAARAKVGDATMAQLLVVAEGHDFLRDIQQSKVFVAVLDWLKQLLVNAKYDGFQGVIQEYSLDNSPTPQSELTKRLDDLARNVEAGEVDPFHGACTDSATGVLAGAMIKPVSQREAETPARTYGRRLAQLELTEVVDHYIRGFIFNAIKRILDRADPDKKDRWVRNSREPLERAAERMARRAVKRVQKRGKLTDSKSVRDIVFEELRRFGASRGLTGAKEA